MKKLIFLILFFSFSLLFFSFENTNVNIDAEGFKSCNIQNCINPISGDYVLDETDLVIPGYEPIVLKRIYSSGGQSGKQPSWYKIPHAIMGINDGENDNVSYITLTVQEPSGMSISYKNKVADNGKDKHQFFPILGDKAKGITNTSRGYIGGSTNVANNKIHWNKRESFFILTACDGTDRYYKKESDHAALLQRERKPNGNWVHYQFYSDKRPKCIYTTNPDQTIVYAKVSFVYSSDKAFNTDCDLIKSEQGYIVKYSYGISEEGENRYFSLNKIETPFFCKEELEYGNLSDKVPTKLIFERKFDEKTFHKLEYFSEGEHVLFGDRYPVRKKDHAHGKVKTLKLPVGENGEFHVTHRLRYLTGQYATENTEKARITAGHLRQAEVRTLCFDAYDNKTEYNFDNYFRPLEIHRFSKDGIKNTEGYVWSTTKLGSYLLSKYEKNENGEIALSNCYAYDASGNIIKQVLGGNLSGENFQKVETNLAELPLNKLASTAHTDCFVTTFTYDTHKYHLPKSKTLPNGYQELYEYKADTNLLTKKLTLDNGIIKTRLFRTYSNDNVLIEEVVDDGNTADKENLSAVTFRKVVSITPKNATPALYFPEVVEEKYYDTKTKSYKLLKKVAFHYNKDCDVIKEDYYDAKNALAFSLHKTYDEKRRLIASSDALGRKTSFAYNNFNYLIKTSSEALPYSISYVKDLLGRTLVETKTFANKESKEVRYFHDLKSRIYKTIDEKKNVTTITYDELDNPVAVTLPKTFDASRKVSTPIAKKTFDYAGRPLQITDVHGDCTSTTYNAIGKPLSIIYADGTSESFTYNIDGTLNTHTTLTKNQIRYTYDTFQRVLKKETFSPEKSLLEAESFKYNSFQLLEHTDVDNSKTLYRYDAFGRKSEERREKNSQLLSLVQFEYDSLGRLYKTIQCGKNPSDPRRIFLKTFDLMGRTVEEKEEDEKGAVFSKVTYEYDKFDNKIAISKHLEEGLSVERFCYDKENRLISYTDAFGSVTHYTYEENILNPKTGSLDLLKTTIDPKGRKLKELFSSTGLLLSQETVDTIGEPLAKEEYFYDLKGSKVKQTTSHYLASKKIKETSSLWEYDTKDRVTKVIEAYEDPMQKVTTITYTQDGKESSITKPNGITLFFTYDLLNNLQKLESSDKTISYFCTHDKMGRILSAKDLIQNKETIRSFDLAGNVEKETLETGICLEKEYDFFDRSILIKLPDASTITKSYDAFHLKKITRHSKSNEYEHNYLSYNSQHQPTLISNAYDQFTQINTFDFLGRYIKTTSPHYTQEIMKFDPCGNILAKRTQSALGLYENSYSYDQLDHLIEEKGKAPHSYAYDSLHNRRLKDSSTYQLNSINELLSQNAAKYLYDQNGNRTSFKEPDSAFTYTYDALDRLTSIQTPTLQINYTYDFWHRRLSKEVRSKTYFGSDTTSYETYIYDDGIEIGSLDEQKALKTLRVLGVGKGADIGAAIAIELENTVYIPLHDLFGNITSLIHAQNNYIAATFEYTAYGESTLYNSYNFSYTSYGLQCPWRYQSKRVDDETGLVLFGRRYYDPTVGSWTTTDPEGLSEGPSLYQYLLGNPFVHVDFFGLAVDQETEEPRGAPFVDKDPPIYNPNPNAWMAPLLASNPNPYGNNAFQTTPDFQAPYRDQGPSIPIRPYLNPNATRFYDYGSNYPTNPNVTIFVLGGIKNDFNSNQAFPTDVANALKMPVKFMHYTYDDGWQAALNVISLQGGLDNYESLRFRNEVKQSLRNSDSDVFFLGHSCGGLIGFTTAKSCVNDYKDRLNIATFGSATYIPGNFGKRVRNYVSEIDLVSFVSNHHYSRVYDKSPASDFTWKALCKLNLTNTTMLKPNSLSPFKEHGIMGETYTKQRTKICKEIIKRYGKN